MAKLLCACLFVCVQLVFCQFGFFPQRDNRGFSQSLISPTRIRNRLQGVLSLQPQNPGTTPTFVYPFRNRPIDEYGRPIYEYRPNYEYSRPNYDYGRPSITNNNLMPQNQFGVPNRNDFYQQNSNQNGFQNLPSQNGFQDQPNQDEYQNTPNQVSFPDTLPQNEYPNNNGNGFQNPPSQNGFQNPPNQNEFQNQPSQNGFQDQPSNGFQNPPSQNGFQDQPSNGFLNPPSQNGFQNQPSNGFQNPPSENGFQNAPSQVGFPNSENESPNNEENTSQDAALNNDSNTNGQEGKQNEDSLIVIPGNAGRNEDGLVFGGPSNSETFPDSNEPTTSEVTKAPETSEVSEEPKTPKAVEASTASPATPAFPPLTPVSTDSRNNFNFGPSGIFQETCTTVENEVGSCLPVTECQPYLKLIKESRSNPNALQLLRQAHCGFQGSNPKVCCPRPGIPTGPPPTLPPSTTTTTEAAVVMPVEPEPSEEPKEMEQQLAPITLPEAPVCGVSNASFSRVVGGIPAKLGDFPWMALLGYKERRAGAGARWLCGGSLISARHVLTAAHCIHTRENDLYLVRLGELDLSRDDEGATPVDVLIKTRVKHQEYDPKSFTNDIGILVLSRNVQFTNLIQPICIPRSSELRARSFENYNPLIAGWGDTEFRGPSAQHLQVLQLPVVSNEYCAQAYSGYKAQVIDQRVLCAGFKKGGKDACQGDSGGPLMQPIYGTETRTTFFYQIGVVSYGKKCAEAGFPGVYTRVTNFVPWIEETVANN